MNQSINRFLFGLFLISWHQDLLHGTFICFIYDCRFLKSSRSCSTSRPGHMKGRGYIYFLSSVYPCGILYNEYIVGMKRQREFTWSCEDLGLCYASGFSHPDRLVQTPFLFKYRKQSRTHLSPQEHISVGGNPRFAMAWIIDSHSEANLIQN